MSFDQAAPNHFRQDVVDEYPGGHKVTDHYRWLEDPDGADTVKWVEAQNKITGAYLDTLGDRAFLKEKLTEKYNYTKTGSTFVRGKGEMKRYYYNKNDGLQNQYVLYSSLAVDGDRLKVPRQLERDEPRGIRHLLLFHRDPDLRCLIEPIEAQVRLIACWLDRFVQAEHLHIS